LSGFIREGDEEVCMNVGTILAALAGVAIAAQVVVNTLGIRSLGVGALIGVSGLATAAAGFAVALLSRPEFTVRSVLYGFSSGVIGAFILAAIVLAAGRAGLAQTLSLVVASQLIAGLLIDRTGVFGSAAADFGPLQVLGVALVLVGGLMVVRG
jgi:bacterial/archaeal transporter family-2 protein